MWRAVPNVERQLADRRLVTIHQPPIGREGFAGDAVAPAVLFQPFDPEQIVLVRSLDRHAELRCENAGRPAMVDVTVGQQDLFDPDLRLLGRRSQARQVAARIDKAPTMVSVHHSRVQFCCSGSPNDRGFEREPPRSLGGASSTGDKAAGSDFIDAATASLA